MAPLVKKRVRVEGNFGSRKKTKHGQKVNRLFQKSSTRPVSLDSLPWQEVAFPESGFEDAEGLFGLEEISDVEVVKDPKLGKVEYRISSDIDMSRNKPQEMSNYVAEPNQTKNTVVRRVTAEDDQWEGFEETDEADGKDPKQAPEMANAERDARDFKLKTKRRQKKDGKDVLPKQAPSKSLGNPFDALAKVHDDTDDAVDQIDVSAWDSLNLSSATLSSITRLNFVKPTSIQRAAVPAILNGHDIIGKAPTGSGKTLAYGLPIYEHYLKTSFRQSSEAGQADNRTVPPIALILSPTRELAHQLSAHLTALCSESSSPAPTIAIVTGGLSVHKQQRLLAKADIVIGTPGRLWEVINGSSKLSKSLKSIKFLVVDEADRLLSEGHFKEVEEILRILDRDDEIVEDEPEDGTKALYGKQQRQTLVFSATFHKDLQQKLAGKGKSFGGDLMGRRESMEYLLKKLNFREEKPQFIDVNPISQMASGLKEGIVECAGTDKDLYLYSLLLHHPNTRTLIFTNSISSVRRLTPFLQNLNIPAQALHSQMPQKARLRSVERFSAPSSQYPILIATDVAARGLDIPSVQLIIHYHLPRAADTYVHRSGRTARAEKSGSSILLCAPEEVQGVRRLVAKVHARNASTSAEDGKSFFMRTIELDRRVVSRVKHRVVLSKKISDAALAKEKRGHEDNWLKNAAEELGVDYDSDEFAAGGEIRRGRGQGRMKKEKEARGLTKAEVGALRAELREELGKRINVGVSERYLTAGGVDVDELLRGERGEFLGRVDGGMEDI